MALSLKAFQNDLPLKIFGALQAFGAQVIDSGGVCSFCDQELNMTSDQRNTIIGNTNV